MRSTPWPSLLLALLFAGCPAPQYTGDDDDATGDDDDATGDDDATPGDDDTTPGDDDTTPGDDDDATGGATEYMYAQTSGELFAVDKDPPYAVTSIGAFSEDQITDLAVDTDGRMWATTYDTVFEVDPQSAQLQQVAALADGSLFALTGLADGTLLAGSDDAIYEVDPVAGTVSWYDSLGNWEFAGDMVGLPDGLLYCLVWPSDHWAESTSLVVYDPASGVTNEIGETGHGSMFGMGFADWTLFGFNTDGEILDVDLSTGAATVVATPGDAFWGAATNPLLWD